MLLLLGNVQGRLSAIACRAALMVLQHRGPREADEVQHKFRAEEQRHELWIGKSYEDIYFLPGH